MLRPILLAVAFAVIPAASAAAAERAEAAARLPMVQGPLASLVAPHDGAELAAGGIAWLAWEPGPGLAEMGRIEEWEAFLSLDGGATFSVRLTPHLALDRKRVAVRLPGTPSDDARLLLRFGDERREVEQPVAARFKLVPQPGHLVPPAHRLALRRGEAARQGQAGVTAWAEGGRDGSGWRELESVETESSLVPAARPSAGLWGLAAGPRDPVAPVSEPPPTGGEPLILAPAPQPPPAPLRSIPILSLTQRLNE